MPNAETIAKIRKAIAKDFTRKGMTAAMVVWFPVQGTWAASTKADGTEMKCAFEHFGAIDITALVA